MLIAFIIMAIYVSELKCSLLCPVIVTINSIATVTLLWLPLIRLEVQLCIFFDKANGKVKCWQCKYNFLSQSCHRTYSIVSPKGDKKVNLELEDYAWDQSLALGKNIDESEGGGRQARGRRIWWSETSILHYRQLQKITDVNILQI